jgi:hypothetical protein
MVTIYLDHNTAHYFVRGFRNNAIELAERAALQTTLGKYPNLRFAVSAWNIIEAASERDQDTAAEMLADRYADFFDSLKPLHLPAHDVIEREEMRFRAYSALGLSNTAPKIPVFNDYLSQVLALSGINDGTVGYDLRADLRYLSKDPKRREPFENAKQVALQARETLIKAKQDGRYGDPVYRQQVLREWFWKLLPERRADQSYIPIDERKRVLEILLKEPDLVFKNCPAIYAEDTLTDVRANMGHRRPRTQDAMDLMHSIVPVAYCDALVSNDGNVREGLGRISRITGRPLVIASRLSKALARLD